MAGRAAMLPFRGYLFPGLCFASGDCMWAFNLESTPFGPYSEIWLVGADGKRTLYADPEAVAEVTKVFHEFDEIVGAEIRWRRPDDSRLGFEVSARDGTSLEVRARLGGSPATGFLNALTRLMPGSLMRTGPLLVVSRLLLNALLRVGVTLRGRTETGKRFFFQTARLALVEEASAVLDGAALGALTRLPAPVDFGDIRTSRRPIVAFGSLYLEDDPRLPSAAEVVRAAAAR